MAEIYQSSFTGPEIDNTVTSSLFGVTVNGTSAPINNHIANIEIPIYQTGTWVPIAYAWAENGETVMPPTMNYDYRAGQYTRFGDLCFVNFYMKFTIGFRGYKYASIDGLPFTASNSITKQTLAMCDYGSITWVPTPTVAFQINGGTSDIKLEYQNGIYATQWPADVNDDIYISGSGVYKIQV